MILLPGKDCIKEIDLSLSTFCGGLDLDKEVYHWIKSKSELLEKLSPLILKDKYLVDKDYVETKNAYESFYKIPGELRM